MKIFHIKCRMQIKLFFNQIHNLLLNKKFNSSLHSLFFSFKAKLQFIIFSNGKPKLQDYKNLQSFLIIDQSLSETLLNLNAYPNKESAKKERLKFPSIKFRIYFLLVKSKHLSMVFLFNIFGMPK